MKAVKESRSMPFGYFMILSTLVVILIATLGYSYFAERATSGFKKYPYENMPEYYELTQFRGFLEMLSVDLSVPGTDGEELTFSSPMAFHAKGRYGTEYKIKAGDTLCSDFVSWSGDNTSNRHIKLSVNGQAYDVNIAPRKVAKLYIAALEQNGLTEQFYQDTGKTLSMSSARDALRTIDAQIFGKNIYAPWDYPFDRDFWKRIAGLVAGCWPFALGFIFIVFESIADYGKYLSWLEEYNRENQGRWDKISGTLPQFVSLEGSGERGKPRFKYQHSDFGELLKRLFSTEGR